MDDDLRALEQNIRDELASKKNEKALKQEEEANSIVNLSGLAKIIKVQNSYNTLVSASNDGSSFGGGSLVLFSLDQHESKMSNIAQKKIGASQISRLQNIQTDLAEEKSENEEISKKFAQTNKQLQGEIESLQLSGDNDIIGAKAQ